MVMKKKATKVAVNNEPVIYRLKNGLKPLSFDLAVGRNGDLTYFDEKTRKPVAIRHCPNEKSIALSQQSDFAVVTPITFTGGFLTVMPREVMTIDFLDSSPHSGDIYERIDAEQEAFEEIEYDELVLTVKSAILAKSKAENGIFMLQSLLGVVTGDFASTKNKKDSQIKRDLYALAETNPTRFVSDNGEFNAFDTGDFKRKDLVLRSLDVGVIKKSISGQSVIWGDNGKDILIIPKGKDFLEYLSEFLGDDDGIPVAREMEERL